MIAKGIIDYRQMRTKLEDFLLNTAEHQRKMELWIYDLMVNLREGYNLYKEAENRKKDTEKAAWNASDVQKKALALDDIVEYDKECDALKSKVFPEGQEPKAPAFIFVLGYNPRLHNQYVSNGDQFEKPLLYSSLKAVKELTKTAYQDGAVLADKEGYILAKRVLLDNLDINKLLYRLFGKRHMNLHSAKEVSETIGLRVNGHARTKFSLAASWEMPFTVIYTMSEETGHIRRMQKGKITHSTVTGEGMYRIIKQEELPKSELAVHNVII